MTSIAELEAALKNPNVQKMLGLIGQTEGTDKLHGYNTKVGGKRIDDLSFRDNSVGLTTKDGPSTAMGRYQIVGKTWKGLQKQYGFSDFQPHTQDLAAVALLAGRGALNDVIKGDFQSALHKSRNEWVSLPNSDTKNQGEWSMARVNKFLGTNYSAPTVDSSQVAQQEAAIRPSAQSFYSQEELPVNTQASQQVAHPDAPSPIMIAKNEQVDAPTIQPVADTKKQYAAQLAAAFGEPPDMSEQFPDELDSLIRSVFEQA